MVAQIKKTFNYRDISDTVYKLTISLVIFGFGLFINRGVSLSPTSLGVYFDELARSLPDISSSPFPHRILLPFISYITRLDVQIINIILLYLFVYNLFSYLLNSKGVKTAILICLIFSTTMVFQFHIIYGGYPDILSLLLYLLCLKNIKNNSFFIYFFLSLLVREAALIVLPIFVIIKFFEKEYEKLMLKLFILIVIYLPIYFLLQNEANMSNSNGWEFYLMPLLNDPLFWFKISIGYYWLGFFSSVKFVFLLFPLIIRSFKDFFLLFSSFVLVNVQFIVSGGDNTRYWLIFFIPIIYLLEKNFIDYKYIKIFLIIILFLNITTPKYYVFGDTEKWGSTYVTPYGSRLHIFDIYSFFEK